MRYEKEELLPIVAKLAEKYTGKESTSISYEKARQFMGAVLYCINEFENAGSDLEEEASLDSLADAETAYEYGYELVVKKVKNIRTQYHKMMNVFQDYGNDCCHDTFLKGIPAFFLYYNARFDPGNHILTLDYPVLGIDGTKCGADLMEQYINGAYYEQILLEKLPYDYVTAILNAYSSDYNGLIINLASIVLRDILACRMIGKSIGGAGYSKEELDILRQFVSDQTKEELENCLKKFVDEFMDFAYEGNLGLGDYLKMDLKDYSFVLKHGAEYGYMESLFNGINKKRDTGSI